MEDDDEIQFHPSPAPNWRIVVTVSAAPTFFKLPNPSSPYPKPKNPRLRRRSRGLLERRRHSSPNRRIGRKSEAEALARCRRHR
ncbi:hypothetical protein C2S52_004401 [Perilla frutescens var. hirtella]|nr:hypothetical protein C2S51_011182 [Perilla frutescens var. frutescens]KAH6793924.1 hypothetical protein C2S52_004401 [Perilla frutescens var. hirtella]